MTDHERVLTRRHLQVALGLLWLFDGALQLQPYMFTRGFADRIIAPAADGQPRFVGVGVDWAAGLIGAHPVVWDGLFAGVQIALGIAMLLRPVVRLALLGSVAWAAGVWYFGEGLNGLASAHADLLTGAPGAVLLYAVLALIALPGEPRRAARWVPVAWAALWVGGAVLTALPGQNRAAALAGEVRGNADGAPSWLARLDRSVASGIGHGGGLLVVGVVVVLAAIGLGGLFPGTPRRVAVGAGIAVSAIFWVVGQSLGELYSGQATDPQTAPLVVLLALVLASVGVVGASRVSRRASGEVVAKRPAQRDPSTIGAGA